MKPTSVQVITLAPTAFYHCQHCEVAFQEVGLGERLRRKEAAEALPEDLAREFQALSDWIHDLLQKHGGRIRVRILDAASIEGFVASLRYRVGKYPAVIIDGAETHVGADFRALDASIERKVSAAANVP